jgi:hypothetical protein
MREGALIFIINIQKNDPYSAQVYGTEWALSVPGYAPSMDACPGTGALNFARRSKKLINRCNGAQFPLPLEHDNSG